MQNSIQIELFPGDALSIETDVLALKYAQGNYGLDEIVSDFLINAGTDRQKLSPKPEEFRIVRSVGDVMQWVKDRISSAKLVIAVLTEANPNVYLEVGYAWGQDIPVVLLVNDTEDLKFDVKGQRCLKYRRIKDLEEILTLQLATLRSNGSI